MADNQNRHRNSRYIVISGLLIVCVVNACWMLSKTALHSHECFVSVTAREMLRSGDWVVPTLNGQRRLNKTPLCYWLVAGLAEITGQVDEFTARFPSAVFAVLTAIIILFFVNKWLSFRIAVLCCSVWATSLAYIRYAHNARTDMALTFFITLCFLSFYSAVNSGGRREQIIYAVIFWASLGLGNLAKGPAPLPLVFLPLLCFIVFDGRWAVLPKLLPFAGGVILLAISLPWPLFIAHKLNWELALWKHEFVDRLFGGYAPGDHPLYYYCFIMFQFIAPWSGFLPMALAAPFYKVWGRKRAVMKFLWLWFVMDFVFLSVDACKRQHYILPLMPAMAILIGIVLEDMAFVQRAYTANFRKRTLGGHIVAVITGAVISGVYIALYYKRFLPGAILLNTVAIGMTAVAAVLFAKKKPAVACGVCFATISVCVVIFMLSFSAFLDVDRGGRDFAQKIAGIVPASDKLVAYGGIGSMFVQYFGKVVPVINDTSTLYKHYQQGDWVIATSKHLPGLRGDNRFRKVYWRKVRPGFKESAGGTLFHISAPIIRTNHSGEEKRNFIWPGGL